MTTKQLGWKDSQVIQNTGIRDSEGNSIVDQREILKVWENYVTEFYDRANRQENLEVETEGEVDEDQKGPMFCTVK
jgi:hypothetical protein